MRNVLQLIDSFDQGGSERQAVQLTKLLHQSGKFKVHVACLSSRGVLKSGSGAPYDALQYAVYARYDLLCKNRANQAALLDLPYVAGM